MSQPEENRAKSLKTDAVLMPDKADRAQRPRRRADEVRQVAEVYGSDVRSGPEVTEAPQAVGTEPSD